jgi:hypothetical protein
MKLETHNTWANYPTWRVFAEIFAEFDPREHFTDADNDEAWRDELAENLRVYADNYIIHGFENAASSVMADFANAFLSYVDWRQIADRMIDEYAEV